MKSLSNFINRHVDVFKWQRPFFTCHYDDYSQYDFFFCRFCRIYLKVIAVYFCVTFSQRTWQDLLGRKFIQTKWNKKHTSKQLKVFQAEASSEFENRSFVSSLRNPSLLLLVLEKSFQTDAFTAHRPAFFFLFLFSSLSSGIRSVYLNGAAGLPAISDGSYIYKLCYAVRETKC